MNKEADESYWDKPEHNRRRPIPGRRGRDFETCSQHQGTCADIKELRNTMVPRWVAVSAMVLMLGFVSWVSLKGISNTESIIEMKAEQKATSANVVQLMKHFDLVPVQPIKK